MLGCIVWRHVSICARAACVLPVFTCCCSEALLRLASENVDLNLGDYDARTPLHLASFGGHLEAVIFLLEQFCEINPVDRWGSTPLNDAKTPEIAELLRHNGAKSGVQQKVNEDSSIMVSDSIFPLLYAVYGNDLALTQSMLLCGHSSLINNCDYDGRSALGVAASEGHLQMVRYLVTHGADVDHKDVRGNNALADAKREKRYACTQMLLLCCALALNSCLQGGCCGLLGIVVEQPAICANQTIHSCSAYFNSTWLNFFDDNKGTT